MGRLYPASKPSGGAAPIRMCRPPTERAKNRSLCFDDLLDAKVRTFNPRYADAMACPSNRATKRH